MYVRQRESGSRRGRGPCAELCPATAPRASPTATPRGLSSAALPLTDVAPSPRGQGDEGAYPIRLLAAALWRWWRRSDWSPATGALLHIRVVALRIIAIVPGGLGRGLRR